jgi:membrane-associated phospholipid phosphatase
MGNVLGLRSAPTRTVKPDRRKGLAASVALSALFIVVYGGCNWITAQRANVGSIDFGWERHLPFVPLLIPAYMSLDLFFIAAPFLCRSELELLVLTKRIVAAILVAGACFLVLPLRFAFERPIATGWSGLIFNWFRTLDAPFNQFPSLHIALCSILCVTYWQRTRGALRVAVVTWFVLVAASAVLTYQHHVLDVAGGAALAAACIYGISARFTAIEHSKSSAAEAL